MKDLINYQPGSSRLFLEMPHSGQRGIENLKGVPAALAQRLRLSSDAVRASLVFGCDIAVPAGTLPLMELYGLARFPMASILIKVLKKLQQLLVANSKIFSVSRFRRKNSMS